MPLGAEATPQAIEAMDEFGIEAAITLSGSRPSAILYACTASSLLAGRAYDLELMRRISAATGVTTLTTTECVLRALDELEIGTIAAASPYAGKLASAEGAFLRSCGLDVAGEAHLGIAGSFELALPTDAEIVHLGLDAWGAAEGRAEGLFIGCMNLHSHRVAAQLEQLIGAPVVTATTASLWAMLQTVGSDVTLEGFGRLLARTTCRAPRD
ncbi:hypothetical protein [Agrococcus sp. ARC_14]|uniref:maleate cis-trans isomerase family protein n=1 Tax=Agrococcus sp. ARC_14 TaxID=2919927 RepID=UPI001F053BBD|nr:hypothetical protein [Agrococcus sp. ARC_14]MCH1881399.1 hypothetical protein [Agrococcus sp. ARC_14]